MASPTGEMTFWDHLDALRGVLLRVAAVMFVAAVGAFIAMPWVFDRFIMGPCSPDFPLYALFDRLAASCGVELDGAAAFRGVEVVSLELASQFFIHMSASCWLALVVAFPIIIYLLWGFVAPGLYPQEKRGVRRVFVFGNLMFYIGVAVGYCLVIPLTVRFLADYRLSESIGAIVFYFADTYGCRVRTACCSMVPWKGRSSYTRFFQPLSSACDRGTPYCIRTDYAYGRSVHSRRRIFPYICFVGT